MFIHVVIMCDVKLADMPVAKKYINFLLALTNMSKHQAIIFKQFQNAEENISLIE